MVGPTTRPNFGNNRQEQNSSEPKDATGGQNAAKVFKECSHIASQGSLEAHKMPIISDFFGLFHELTPVARESAVSPATLYGKERICGLNCAAWIKLNRVEFLTRAGPAGNYSICMMALCVLSPGSIGLPGMKG